MLKRSSGSLSAQIEGLEPRQLLSKPAPITKFSQPAFYFNDIAQNLSGGSGQSRTQYLIIRNAGTLPLIFNSKGLRIQGDNADEFMFVGKSAPATIEPGATRTIAIAFKANSEGIKSAILLAKSNDTRHNSVSIPLRGLGTAGEGGDKEPSLQKVLDLYQIPVNVGDSNPNNTEFKVPASQPNDEVSMQQMVKADPSKPVDIQWLGNFVVTATPTVKFGYYHPGQPELGQAGVFWVKSTLESQSVAPTLMGKPRFDPGTSPFGIYVQYPSFTYRQAFSEDALNTWEPKSQNRKKIRFYPMKNPDGSIEPNAFVFAGEDFTGPYDFQDGVGIIRNVMKAPGAPSIGIVNQDGLPAYDSVALNRIQILDIIRPNVVHDTATISVLNTGSSSLNVSSMQLSDGSNFKIISGGGSNFKISPNSSRSVTIQFVAAPSSGVTQQYNGTLTINSDDPDEPSRVVKLSGLWQLGSEKTPDNKYSEPSLKTVASVFGYTTVITKPGETTNHKGKAVMVGDEVTVPYWDQAESAQPITVRQLAAFHRQNNFDPLTGEPLPANSSIGWYAKGSPETITKILAHNIDEGQALLPHLSGSSTKPAQATFRQKDNKPFGLVVDKKHFTDQSLNALDFDPVTLNTFPNTGYAWRIYPAKDANGKTLPNTYIFAQDYTANEFANWDYQDNIYLISNVKPHLDTNAQGFAQVPSRPIFGSTSVGESSDQSVLKDDQQVL